MNCRYGCWRRSVDVVAALDANVGTIIWISEEPDDSPESQLIANGRIHVISDISGVAPLIEHIAGDWSITAPGQ